MDGILVIDKPSGWTSHDVVNFVRRRFKSRKVGHAGTLDPDATGVLVVLMGKAVKLSARLCESDKEYHGRITFGKSTTTQDASGETLSVKDFSGLTEKAIEEAFKKFTGEIEQVPPMVSAIKANGKKLYELARKGIEVERKPRRIFIGKFELTKVELPDAMFVVNCSKGTYVRTLCHDIGQALGCGGHLSSLRRTRSGEFSINDASTIDELRKLEPDKLKGLLKDGYSKN